MRDNHARSGVNFERKINTSVAVNQCHRFRGEIAASIEKNNSLPPDQFEINA